LILNNAVIPGLSLRSNRGLKLANAFGVKPQPKRSYFDAKAQRRKGKFISRDILLGAFAPLRQNFLRKKEPANPLRRDAQTTKIKRIMEQLIRVTLFVVVAASQTFAQDWDKYKPRTLKEITTALAEASFKDPDVIITDSNKGESIVLSGNTFPSRVAAVYTGSSRKVSDKKKEVIAAWLRVFGKPSEYLKLFEAEYLFTEDEKEYWLPVQKQVAAYFEKELRKSDTVGLYAVRVGARKDSRGIEHVFLINEFEKEAQASLTPPIKFFKAKKPIPNRYIVVLKDDVVSDDAPLEVRRAGITAIAKRHAEAHRGKFDYIYDTALKGYAIQLPNEAAAIAISNLPEVRWVEEDAYGEWASSTAVCRERPL
jgi:hypothetical protein